MTGLLKLKNFADVESVIDVLFAIRNYSNLNTRTLQGELRLRCLNEPKVEVTETNLLKILNIDDYTFTVIPIINPNTITGDDIVCRDMILSEKVICKIHSYDEDGELDTIEKVEGSIILDENEDYKLQIVLTI